MFLSILYHVSLSLSPSLSLSWSHALSLSLFMAIDEVGRVVLDSLDSLRVD